MKAIITTTGEDRVGILAQMTQFISQMQCNVEDITQTIMQGNFVMIMMVSINGEHTFSELKEGLDKLAEEVCVSIRVQRAEIFEQMHHV